MCKSHQIESEIIDICSDVLKSKLIEEVKHASIFSVLAEETADVKGTEQLSVGVCYLRCDKDDKKIIICEEYLGYVTFGKLSFVF